MFMMSSVLIMPNRNENMGKLACYTDCEAALNLHNSTKVSRIRLKLHRSIENEILSTFR